jgi:hydroxymethylpyrimidine pyrophosphatase-like HAD family hydrolase
MRFEALATDYDGTIAHDGTVYQPTLDALSRARAAGLRLVMVTGRELRDLFSVFPHPAIFERIVAENGAVLYDPATQTTEFIASAPPPAFIERLRKEGVPVSIGHSIVATVEPFEHQVLAAIHDLGLEWHIIFNKGSVMALPSDVTKSTGLAKALDVVGVPWDATIGVGDAENDLPFLRRCGFAAAVRNALPSVQEIADLVTAEVRGAGVAELISGWLAGALDSAPMNVARDTRSDALFTHITRAKRW